MTALLILLHLLSAVVWVGGMFFAYLILRPAAVTELEPPLRLRLWSRVLAAFFRWVWAAVLLLPITGLALAGRMFGGLAQAPVHVHVMLLLGTVMILIFLHVFFAPGRRLHRAVADEDWPEGGRQLGRIRRLVGVNLLIGLVVIALAGAGRFPG